MAAHRPEADRAEHRGMEPEGAGLGVDADQGGRRQKTKNTLVVLKIGLTWLVCC